MSQVDVDALCAKRTQRPARSSPIIRMLPRYPRAAYRSKTEGHVLVEFTVRADGRTDEFAVLESEPPGMFDKAALGALHHWRYCPRPEGYPERMKVKLPFRLR